MSDPVSDALELLCRGPVVALTGAGISTESGIPDYRGNGTAPRRTPMTYAAFTNDRAARRRYWARSHLGWRHLRDVQPNRGHRALAELERRELVIGTITQNVDGLHQAAGSRHVIDLHGRLDRVVCLRCHETTDRAVVWGWFDEANPGWSATVYATNPDGDTEIAEADVASFVTIDCPICGGLLKPDVVYVGESVPADRVDAAHELLDRAHLLLVLGSSLTVWSGRRFVTRAARTGVPVAIVNDGPTRGDEVAAVKVEGRLGEVLSGFVHSLSLRSQASPLS